MTTTKLNCAKGSMVWVVFVFANNFIFNLVRQLIRKQYSVHKESMVKLEKCFIAQKSQTNYFRNCHR